MSTEEKTVKTIQSVHRALNIWEFLIDEGNGFSLATIAEHCGLNKTTAFHLLKTLESRGYVEQSFDTQFYKISWKSYELARKIYDTGNFTQAGKPYLEQLYDKYNETSYLCLYSKIENHFEAICQYSIVSSNLLHTIAPVGSRLPLHCTAVGKAYLSSLSREMFNTVLGNDPLAKFTQNTITDRDLLYNQVQQIKQQGYCIEYEEFQPDVCSLAIPVIKYTGRAIFSLAVSMPVQRATDQTVSKIIAEMIPMAQELSKFSF